ncbi:MAG: hypothetical protein ACKOWD_13130 [Rhodoferax sp.]
MNNNIQKRKQEDPSQAKPGLARRATDTTLKGMQVKEDDSDGSWADWEAAVQQAESDPAPDTGDSLPGGDGPDTKPIPLDPGP